MGTICFSCKKNIGLFKPRAHKKEIIRVGYTPPNDMSDKDSLCQECLSVVKLNQVQGKNLNSIVGVTGQIILCLIPVLHYILQSYAFIRINKFRKFLIYFLIIHVPAIVMVFTGFSFAGFALISYIGAAGLIGGYFIPVIWIIDWTREYNKNFG